ncbi:MAG: aldehyde dehydrogenase family protein [Proteobacteria bacterium]|nr:aldehyde dehydrogenase family protein [Pseudomonadota bacterium]
MKKIEKRLEKVHQLIEAISDNRDQLIEIAVRDAGFTIRECRIEVDMNLDNLRGFDEMVTVFSERQPICRLDQEVALLLPYNGSAWLNTAIISIFLVGNRVQVKFATRGSEISRFTESLYKPIFGDAICFEYSDGRSFLENAMSNPNIPAICLFGSDDHALGYQNSVKKFGKKFIFEGPGKDPFLVLPGADLEAATKELAFSKYIYAGQTCTAPERVYVHESLHDAFVERFVELSREVKTGDPADPDTQMGPVASARAIANIKAQLKDAVDKGARVVLGGCIDGHMVYPTVVVGATQDMLGVREETFGPVSFISTFKDTDEALRLVRDNRYGLRASVYGDETAVNFGNELVGEPYCHPVDKMVFGMFGTVGVNQGRSESWKGAFVSKPVGGYGYSGWIWETINEKFILKQGPKLLSIETSQKP